MKLEPFQTKENTKKTSSAGRYSYSENDDKTSFTSAAVKIGLCIAICIALCIVNMTMKGSSELFAMSDEEENSPGKLRFVELPGIIEVFAGKDKLTMPIGEYSEADWDDDKNMLKLVTNSNETVVTCGSGTVKAIGTDSEYGNYVVIRHGSIETCYYGLGYVTVEERQVINKLDTLGLLTQSGIMYFQVYKDGQPENPCNYLPLNID